MSYLGARQHEVNAARASSMEALRAFSQRQTARDFQTAEARAARGLVSVSTSGFAALPTAMRWVEQCITIDRAQARLHMHDGTTVPCSRRYRDALRAGAG
ncbi:hypothetical protein [Variovorax sp. PAMC26660]|uniref:hypothetical protein n=1 Tax=Variovorax sp. PAMC26660 TaxID=2762322 RepID=UPI00164E0772|nr:hypothetical protein [Variovorax sp. PAMC26660]QNK71832.1 hypothetical protein H7F35_00760 [Variovorax sp. PAMC26660]